MAFNNLKAAIQEHLVADADVNAILDGRIYPLAIPKDVVEDDNGLPVAVFSVLETDYVEAFEGNIAANTTIAFTCFTDKDLGVIEDAIDKIIAAFNLPRTQIGTTNQVWIQSAKAVGRSDEYLENPGLFGDSVRIQFNICE